MHFQADYRHLLDAVHNKKSTRLAFYEHRIEPTFMEKVLDFKFAQEIEGSSADQHHFMQTYCDFFERMTYDTVSYEVCITQVLPEGGALLGERPGPIQSEDDFKNYPWEEIPQLFWQLATPQFDLLREHMPAGMKAVGGIGNGIFEIAQDLVGFERLCLMQYQNPQLFEDLFARIGQLVLGLWENFLHRYSDIFAIARIGDDMGFKTGTLLAPQTFLNNILPQYRPIIERVHHHGLPYLQHSCGKIFELMDAMLDNGIDAKHSNEDVIADFGVWIERYGDRIGLLGGVDTDRLCTMDPSDLFQYVVDKATQYRAQATGFALGSGNSIPDYVPVEGYLAMIKAGQKVRQIEAQNKQPMISC